MSKEKVKITPDDVVVEMDVAAELLRYFAEIGRHGKLSLHDLVDLLAYSIAKRWDGPEMIPIQEGDKDGWAVDLSDSLGGEVIYAIVYMNKSKLQVSELLNEDQARVFFTTRLKNKKKTEGNNSHLDDYPTQAQMEIDPENPSGSSLAEQRDYFRKVANTLQEENKNLLRNLGALRQANADDVVLLRWKTGKEGNGMQKAERTITMGAIGSEVYELIYMGIKPEDIEIWSKRQQPKVKVELE